LPEPVSIVLHIHLREFHGGKIVPGIREQVEQTDNGKHGKLPSRSLNVHGRVLTWVSNVQSGGF
jgi:hypothetical protein